MSVDEHTIELGTTPVFYRSAPAAGAPPLYLHDIPTSSDDWIPFLERAGGIAPDLIGFGRTGKGVGLDYSLPGLADFVEDLLGALAIDTVQLVGHGWGGAVVLELLRRRRPPLTIERAVLLNPLPLVDNFRWPAIARVWQVRIIGELAMGFTTRRLLARGLRRGTVNREAWSEDRLRGMWEQFDQGTQRAMLRLHRSVDGPQAATPTAPALLIWGEEDPWFPVALADTYRALLPGAELERIAGAGHWPWLDQPDVIEHVANFLAQ